MDLPPSRPSARPEPKSSRNKQHDSSKTRSSRANEFTGGDPFVSPPAARARFQQSNSAHRSVLSPPPTTQPQNPMTVEQHIRSPSACASRLQFSRARNTGVSPDTSHTVPSLLCCHEGSENHTAHTFTRISPIANPYHGPSRQLPFSRSASRSETSNHPRPRRLPKSNPAVPEKETIISLGEDEAAKHPKVLEPSLGSPHVTPKLALDVVDLDGDETVNDYIPVRQAPKRPRTNTHASPHANTVERSHRVRSPSSRANRKLPTSSKVVITGSPTGVVKPPKLKSHATHSARVGIVTDVGKVIGGGNTPTRIDEQETVIVDEVECPRSVETKGMRPSLADVFGHQVKFDKKRADEVMARCERERRSVMILSFLGINDVELHDLWRLHPHPQDNVERSLVLRNNQLTKFTTFLRDKTEKWNITSLDLSHNFLAVVGGISHRLRILNLSRNQLTCFPSGIEKLTELELLDLSRNSIRKAPHQLYRLKKLEILDLTGNNLEGLPNDCFGEGSQLAVLLISFNFGIDSLPACASYLTKLKVFQFEKTAIHSNLPNADLRLEAAELVNMLAGKDARTLAKRKPTGGRELRSRREPVCEVNIVP